MHINHLPIPPTPTNRRRHNHKRIPIHKVAYTSLVLRAVAGLCDEIEFQGEGEDREEEGKEQREWRGSGHRANMHSCRNGKGARTVSDCASCEQIGRNVRESGRIAGANWVTWAVSGKEPLFLSPLSSIKQCEES